LAWDATLANWSLWANSWEWARATSGTAPAEADKDPGRAIGNKFKIEGFLDQAATARVALADANHFLYLCKANQLAAVDPANIKAPVLVLYAPNDLVFYEPIVRETLEKIARGGWLGQRRGTGRTSQCFHRDRAGRRQNRSISREITASAV